MKRRTSSWVGILVLGWAGVQANAVTLIGGSANVNNGGLTELTGPWVKVPNVPHSLAAPSARLDQDHRALTGADGSDWAIGGSEGSGCSPSFDVYYAQTFTVASGQVTAGENHVYLSGWAKAWAGWWSGENWGWVQEAHIELWVDGVKTADMMSSNNANRDRWKFWIWTGTVTVLDRLEVRLRAVKGPGNYNPGNVCGGLPYSAIWYDSRFDDVTLQVASASACPNPATVAGVTPATAEFTTNGTRTLTVHGANLGGITAVRLIGPVIRDGANVIASAGQVSADFDMSNAPRGQYDVIVFQDGACINAARPAAFTVVPGPFANGSFEANDNGNEENELPGWKFLVDRAGPVIHRRVSEGTLFGAIGYPFHPTETTASHYAGNTHEGNGNFHVALAQTFITVPGVKYSVRGGHFGGVEKKDAGGTDGNAWWEVLMVDGDTENMNLGGTVVTQRVRPAGTGPLAFRERFAGEFTATGGLTTIFLKWGHDGGTQSVHMAGWDALVVARSCNVPFADADGDEDIDQSDFGVFQSCYLGSPSVPVFAPDVYRCDCFDRDAVPDGDLDLDDLNAFLNCVTGPAVALDTVNPPVGCAP